MSKGRIPGIFFIIFLLVILACGCTGSQNTGKGTVQFTSSPSGAEVYLDNQYRGTSPCSVADVEPGTHAVEYRLQGYAPWSATTTVISGANQVSATLTPKPAAEQPGTVTTGTGPAPGKEQYVTVQVSRDPIIIGDTITFSGTSSGIERIFLTIYGPGIYTNGVYLDQVRPNAVGLWTFTWRPGEKIRAGIYAVVVSDARNVSSAQASFRAIGNGQITVIPNNFAVSQGDTIRFSGLCTSGAPTVSLVLSGPGRYSGGIDLGTASVMADSTWSFRYTLDLNMPAGTYTISAFDIPKTTSGATQFTIGFAN